MTQSISRRNFLWKSSLAAGAATFLAPALLAKANETRIALSMDSTDRAALDFLSQFSTNSTYVGGGIAARLAGEIPSVTKIAVSVTDLSALRAALGTPKRAGMGNVHINGDQITFAADARKFVAQLSQETEAVFPATATKGADFRFAHHALQFRIATGELSDPFQSEGTLRFLREAGNPSIACADLIDGMIEAKTFRLVKDSDFDARKSRVLSLDGSAAAFDVVRTFARSLSTLTSAISREEMAELLSSNLLNTAFTTYSGQPTALAVSRFETLRMRAGTDYSDGAIWMACVLRPQILDETVGRFLNTEDRLRLLSNREAMLQAIQLLV